MNSNDLSDFAKAFEQRQKVLNMANRTIQENMRKLNDFLNYLKIQGIPSIDGITKEVIQSYQISQYEIINNRGMPNSIPYQNSHLSVVKRFLSFLLENSYIISDPSKGVSYAKEPKMLPRSILTVSEARKIIHSPDVKSAIGYRDRTILEVLYSTGIRKSELCNLTLSDVDYQDGFLRINDGKGKKDRIVPLGKIACRYLENYIQSVRKDLKAAHNQYVFLSHRGKKIGAISVWRLIKKYARKAKIHKNIHCHTFRHSCATSMLKNKADITSIQKLLGHTSLDSTQVYMHLSITDLKEVHKKCHPREKDKE